ncbi:MAG: hypothetical protein IT263_08895 [Saprospiraceae bacterium]|nr:hypothetical protein [Saprospiraceae bacterium]
MGFNNHCRLEIDDHCVGIAGLIHGMTGMCTVVLIFLSQENLIRIM